MVSHVPTACEAELLQAAHVGHCSGHESICKTKVANESRVWDYVLGSKVLITQAAPRPRMWRTAVATGASAKRREREQGVGFCTEIIKC